MRTALVTGVAGQDGVYLARSLRASGRRVVGTVAPGFAPDDPRRTYLDGIDLRPLDVREGAALEALVAEVAPDEVYNLAALSSVGRSWEQPERTAATNAAPVAHLVTALLRLRERGGVEPRLFQASSAEVHGSASDSPYARAKAAADDVVRRAREEHGLFAVCGVLHNHESPLRGAQFVTRKITAAAAEIALGLRESVSLGNLDVQRDWGFAGEYVEAMRLQLAHDEPLDLPIGTGRVHALQDLLERAFTAAGLGAPGDRVVQDPALLRPSDTTVFVADPEPAAAALGWRARVTFAELVDHMVSVDLRRLRTGVPAAVDYLLPARIVA
ncbi:MULTISPECIES: GDP-mannose 4,6-dehydratase [Pimelobacter]|uniref:GDP-mannose 4,6-dehydratase n=1 Tax=Pimelobacter TaxID=2044 RepID=UPI001C03B799|nr:MULTISPECIES: GDP-mannose 4,6-dehydratase [Pimelobacter]UUW90065.1 GDP-mannose 4,6-dehydratase [Pimelobacter simplex]UUW93894.1 GDP-mannose 4,6-dehydratase [Pimelobacter simplex]